MSEWLSEWGRKVILDGDLIPSTRVVLSYICLGRMLGESGDPIQQEIADDLGMSLSTVKRALDQAEARGWIVRERFGLGMPNKMHFQERRQLARPIKN